MTSLETAEQSIAHLNFNVSEEIQTLYDKLSFLYGTPSLMSCLPLSFLV
jgi:hypothetical protein